MAKLRIRTDNPFVRGFSSQGDLLRRRKLEYSPSALDKSHIVKDGDRIDLIAYKYYKNAKLWWVIYDINYDTIDTPFHLVTGTTLIIPDLDRVRATQL